VAIDQARQGWQKRKHQPPSLSIDETFIFVEPPAKGETSARHPEAKRQVTGIDETNSARG
jgi:hypothetical protein